MQFKIVLKSLNSRIKLKIIKFMALNREEITCSSLARKLKVSKSRVSEILREFEREGILESKRIGRNVVYRIKKDPRVLNFLDLVERACLNDLEDIKKKIVPVLRKHGVIRAGIFGSVARGEADRKSDVDILVELPEGKSLLDLVVLEKEIERKLGRKVDLLTYKSIHPLLRERILGEEVRIYEKR